MGQTRREILHLLGGATLATTAAAGLAGSAAATPGHGNRGRIPDRGIGMHLYTVRDLLADDPLGTLMAMSRIGYECVGVSAFPRPADEIRDMCREARLNPVILHVGHGDLVNNLEAKLADAKTIGVRWVVLSSFPGDMYTVEGMELGARQLTEAGRAARELGLGGVLHHNHGTEFDVIGGKQLYEILLHESDPRCVGFELDLGWAHRAGVDSRWIFADHPDRFPVLHVKDHDGAGGWADVGHGVVDFPHIFEKAGVAGVRYWLVERDDQPAPLDTARNSFEYLDNVRW
ncbi:sugar phosphate isomerase/epimerase family protein [Actinophytocola gossypii]|uniref:Sugar phosphate isomerase/epimerase n=1 Tax=Actinophytocola gossypii TaxID=2812003 RepID=A0ABT2JES3_9PSEU|nr:sugar phosphate isomerase/epimerase [Actinophytocola gossypii]MCT2586379.1 sugar phosphate isomerase/epimerase [Actinophytocola gossypii]